MNTTTTITLDKTGRVVIPKGVRDHFGLGAGDVMELKTDARGFRLQPVAPPSRLTRKGGLWVCHSTGKITNEDVERHRQAIYRTRDEDNRNPVG